MRPVHWLERERLVSRAKLATGWRRLRSRHGASSVVLAAGGLGLLLATAGRRMTVSLLRLGGSIGTSLAVSSLRRRWQESSEHPLDLRDDHGED
ncbi:MAG: hypothetical protein KDB53_00075 [Planctomycetes bacterium]|nr:hypothetical protein [Planctomycetota bacterium]